MEPGLENGNRSHRVNFIPDNVATAIIGVTLLFCLLGLVGNGIVLWFLGFRIKRNLFTVYVLNLAAADFGFLLCLPISLTVYVAHLFNLLFLITIMDLLLVFTYSTSLYLLTAISAERCVSVLFPIWHRCRRPTHLSAIVCALLWALSCLFSGLRAYFCFSDSYERCMVVLAQLTGTSFLIFTPIMVLSSLILIIKVRCSSQRRPPGKLYVVILLSVLFFLLFIVPFSILAFFLNIVNYSHFIATGFMLASLNSSINPVIYFFVGSYKKRQFRGTIKKALQNVFNDEANTSEANPSEEGVKDSAN
ncbi:mas-related G-protein coupled receptor member H-like isoform X1 [Pelodiscus sinensis]|uniref:mas-related G-protein coupled receptor member H-like isoform X1 n=1 Tax=Pelodiscus sinensis TaxID=13735 RepID=UPI0003C4410B|nr:mas-related G-protein coupled receptor member H-like [Pelodiscus sinensis]|eukprot:XP_006136443.1 mas-related G-protein coupled receptor member H-like [Pelodiscus sinensis]